MTPEELLLRPWRVGRSVGRTIYAQVGSEPTKEDLLIGVMDHELYARAAVLAHNVALAEALDRELPT